MKCIHMHTINWNAISISQEQLDSSRLDLVWYNRFILFVDTDLMNLAQEVLDVLKKIVGVEVFTQHFTEVQRKLTSKKEDRKRKRAVDVSGSCSELFTYFENYQKLHKFHWYSPLLQKLPSYLTRLINLGHDNYVINYQLLLFTLVATSNPCLFLTTYVTYWPWSLIYLRKNVTY